jgi:hypothetical protein
VFLLLSLLKVIYEISSDASGVAADISAVVNRYVVTIMIKFLCDRIRLNSNQFLFVVSNDFKNNATSAFQMEVRA